VRAIRDRMLQTWLESIHEWIEERLETDDRKKTRNVRTMKGIKVRDICKGKKSYMNE